MNALEARDAKFEEKVRASFARQGMMKHLGAELAELRPGFCEIRAAFRPELSQQHGYFHAGVTGAIADSACGYAAFSLMPAESSVLTVEYKINLLAPADGEWLIARGQVIRAGKTLFICRADVFVSKSGAEKLCASSLATIMQIAERAES